MMAEQMLVWLDKLSRHILCSISGTVWRQYMYMYMYMYNVCVHVHVHVRYACQPFNKSYHVNRSLGAIINSNTNLSYMYTVCTCTCISKGQLEYTCTCTCKLHYSKLSIEIQDHHTKEMIVHVVASFRVTYSP